MNALELVTRIIRDARIPQGHSYREPATLLGMADDAMETIVVPEVLKAAGNHLSGRVDLPIVAGKSKYRLPTRALRGDHVQLLDSASKVIPGFDHADPVNVAAQEGTTGTPRFWYFDASSVVVLPRPALSGGFLRITYARRPSALVLPAACATILDVLPGSGYVNCAYEAADFLGPDATETTVDLVRATPGHESIVDAAAVTVVDRPPLSIDLQGLSADDVDVWDWLCLPNTSPVPQVPLAYHVVLAQAVVVRVFKEMGKDAEHQRAMGDLYGTPERPGGMLQAARDTISPRTRDSRVVAQKDW